MTARYDAALIGEMADPYPHYRKLRAAGRVVRGGPGTWVVTHHADVSALCTDPRLSHRFPEGVYRVSGEPDVLAEFFAATVLNRDPPIHTTLRRAMSRLVAPRVVATLRPRIQRLVTELFGMLRGAGEVDLVASVAYPLPVTVAAELLDLPAGDRDEVRPHAMALGRAFGAGVQLRPDRDAAAQAVIWLRRYIEDLLRSRRDRADDALTALLSQVGPQLSRADLIDNIIFLFFAGFDTTTNLLSTGFAHLLTQPALLHQLRTDPGSVGSAVEELLRYDSPIQASARVTREPINIAGRQISKDRIIVLVLGSANHDERQFAEPERIDLTRRPNPHLGFAAGVHHCLGATLARTEAAVVLAHIATQVRVFEAAGEPVRRLHMSFRGYERVPARIG